MSQDLPPLLPNDSGMHDLRGETIVGRRVEIGGGKAVDRVMGCRVVNCEIRILSSGRATSHILSGNSFEDCAILPRKIQKIVNLRSSFSGCEFKGTYEVDFRDEVSRCSFKNAKLNHAIFYAPTNLRAMDLPGWPHIQICDLDQHQEDFMASVPHLGLLWIMARMRPYCIVANIELASKTPHETWDLLKHKPYVSCEDPKA
jgi:hypothetical protein